LPSWRYTGEATNTTMRSTATIRYPVFTHKPPKLCQPKEYKSR
jgi:hypothetical protein